MPLFTDPEKLQELHEVSSEKVIEQRVRASKIKSLNDHLEVILQKKVRLDLEIRKISSKLQKLKKIQSSIKEGANSSDGSQQPEDPFEGLPQAVRETLEQELRRADRLLENVMFLEPYLTKK